MWITHWDSLFLSIPAMVGFCIVVAILLPVILRSRNLFLWCSGIGLVVPWLSGLAVKLWLQSRGLPTYPYSAFLEEAWLCIVASVLFAVPLMVFGVFAQRVLATRSCCGLTTQRARNCLIAGVLLGTVASMTRLFIDLFWEFDFQSLFFAPLLWIGYLDGAAVGALAGWVVGWWIQGREAESGGHGRTHHERAGKPVH
jgi:hypothetical protein